MSRNYSPSTIDVVGDLINGLRVEVPTFANATYLNQGQWSLFKVYGRVLLNRLFWEAITDNGVGATTMQFNYTFSTPAITVKPMCAVSASIASIVRGGRVVWVGGAVATAAVITVATGGFSDVVNTNPAILGGEGFVGVIGMLTATAGAASGTGKVVACYAPLSDGAYLEALTVPTAP